MDIEHLFLMEPSRDWPRLGLPAGAEVFDGIEGTQGCAVLCPWRDSAAVIDGASDQAEWFRCEMVTDSGAKPGRPAAMMLITFDVPPESAAAFEDWYASEHIPMLLKAEGWLRARRLSVTGRGEGAAGWTSIAVHLLSSLEVLDSEERRLARSTPWRARFASLPWFEAAGRFLYRPDLPEMQR